jgi:23S rRNA (cytidine1920-2'-O)/16S rRNA (cytidine1409-2'-O)-methyltransferase
MDRRAVVSARRRLDDELVRRRLAPSRNQAQADIAAGRVLVAGATADKPARLVLPGDAIVVQADGPRFVSRAGAKLDAALDRFTIDVAGRRVLDAGASTGGFCDCVLQRGAAEVLAVDVGHGQLHERVAGDRRVRVLDRTNVRDLDPATVGEPVDLVTADLSFISLRLVLDRLLAVVRPGGDLVLLVKPQFEAGRQVVSKGRGIVSDPRVWREVLASVMSATDDRAATIMGAMASPITGTDGNVEFLLHVRRSRSGPLRPSHGDATPAAPDPSALVDTAVAEAEDARRLRER